MYTIPDEQCRKCGGITQLNFIPSSGMDLETTGMKRTCIRCGFSEFIETLDEKVNAKDIH